MCVLFSQEKYWLVARWVSFCFFEDCLPHLSHAPSLAANIRFCVDAEVDTLDLRQSDTSAVWELKRLHELIFRDYAKAGKWTFSSQDAYDGYIAHIEKLGQVIDDLLANVDECIDTME